MKTEITEFAKKNPDRIGREIAYMLDHGVREDVLLSEALEAIYSEFKNNYRKAANGDFPDDDPRSDNYRPFGLYGL